MKNVYIDWNQVPEDVFVVVISKWFFLRIIFLVYGIVNFVYLMIELNYLWSYVYRFLSQVNDDSRDYSSVRLTLVYETLRRKLFGFL